MALTRYIEPEYFCLPDTASRVADFVEVTPPVGDGDSSETVRRVVLALRRPAVSGPEGANENITRRTK